MNQLIIKLFVLCSENKVEFLLDLDEGGTNEVFYNEERNVVCLNIADSEDKNLPKLIEDKTKELEQLFQ